MFCGNYFTEMLCFYCSVYIEMGHELHAEIWPIDNNICQHVADQQVVASLKFGDFCFGSG